MDLELSDKSKQLQALDKENSNVKVEIKTFQKCVKDYRKEILNQKLKSEILKNIAKNLNFGLSKTKLIKLNAAEKTKLEKSLKIEMKRWRKQLGLEREEVAEFDYALDALDDRSLEIKGEEILHHWTGTAMLL